MGGNPPSPTSRSSSSLSCSRAPRIRDFAYGLLSPICAYNTPALHVRTAVRNLQPRYASQSCLCRFNPKPLSQEVAAVKVIHTVSVRSGGSAQIPGVKSTTSPRSTINWLAAIVSAERPLYLIISHEGGYERLKGRAGVSFCDATSGILRFACPINSLCSMSRRVSGSDFGIPLRSLRSSEHQRQKSAPNRKGRTLWWESRGVGFEISRRHSPVHMK
jgi:hypothetical protein